jgi:hypothetical protein
MFRPVFFYKFQVTLNSSKLELLNFTIMSNIKLMRHADFPNKSYLIDAVHIFNVNSGVGNDIYDENTFDRLQTGHTQTQTTKL